MNTSEIQNMLRQAPRPRAPENLKARLKAQALRIDRAGQLIGGGGSTGGWLRRWWPALGPAAVSLACAAVFTVQQLEIQGLKKDLERQRQDLGAAQTAAKASADAAARAVAPAGPKAAEQEEIIRLKDQAAKLTANILQLEQMRAENLRLGEQLTAAAARVFSPDETKALEEARDRALSIQCVNNLKQLGLCVRMWTLDNGNVSPGNVFLMTNYMGAPKVLVCPADTGRQPAKDWASFTPANCSYEYLAPSTPQTEDPLRVLFRCPVHGNIGLWDGSVQMGIAKNHPERLVERGGKLYLQ
jgi:hypothetical protein